MLDRLEHWTGLLDSPLTSCMHVQTSQLSLDHPNLLLASHLPAIHSLAADVGVTVDDVI